MKIDTVTLKKQVILHLPYLLFLLVFAKLGQTVRLAPGADASQKLLGLSEGFTLAFQSMWPGAALDWLVGLCGAVIMRLAVYLKGKDAKKYRKNVEYGSARWGSKTDIAPFMDQKPENNIILTQSEGLMMSGRPKNPANARNKNVLVVGGSGSGKTRFFIKPNLMQMHSSYVVTDPKGTVLIEVGKLLSRGTPKLDKDGKPVRGKNGKIVYEPYKIKVFNTINFSKSMENISVFDCDEGDRPIEVTPDDHSFRPVGSSSCFVVGVIGGADGPTAVIYGTNSQEKLHAACSALHFEPVGDDVEWRIVFNVTQFDKETFPII